MELYAVAFALLIGVALLAYVFTEVVPKRKFLRRHKMHKDAYKQFDLIDEPEQLD